jgi:MFS family permease
VKRISNANEGRDMGLFLSASGFWFICVGIQSVFLPWVLISVLHASPFEFGIAQMCLMLPVLILVIYGGYLADLHPLRGLLARLYLLSSVIALLFAVWTYQHTLSYPMLLAYSLLFGVLSAFCAPAREAFLNVLGQRQLQKFVTLNIGIEFGIQVIGFIIGGLISLLGVSLMFTILAALLLLSSIATARISTTTQSKQRSGLLIQTREAFRFSIQHPVILPVLLLNGLIGVFFLGSIFVAMPLHLSQLDGYNASLLATANIIFMIGLISSVATLVVMGGINNKQKALITTCLLASVFLAVMPYVFDRLWMLALLFCWGYLGGIALSMGQTLIQENAPLKNRAQVLALLMLFFMGGNPLGSLLLGTLLEYWKATSVGMTSAIAMILAILVISHKHGLWNSHHDTINSAT